MPSFRDFVENLKAKDLRGSVKLRAALGHFDVDVPNRVCLDVGASTGGFTKVLLERGAAKVYAVDVGHGQLLGSLRQDARVVNLENTNIADVEIDEPIDLVTIDVSYLSLSDATFQLKRLSFSDGANLIGLVKPMFELKRGTAPTDEDSLNEATARATEGIERAGWQVIGTTPAPVRGTKGAIEGFIHATRGSDHPTRDSDGDPWKASPP